MILPRKPAGQIAACNVQIATRSMLVRESTRSTLPVSGQRIEWDRQPWHHRSKTIHEVLPPWESKASETGRSKTVVRYLPPLRRLPRLGCQVEGERAGRGVGQFPRGRVAWSRGITMTLGGSGAMSPSVMPLPPSRIWIPSSPGYPPRITSRARRKSGIFPLLNGGERARGGDCYPAEEVPPY